MFIMKGAVKESKGAAHGDVSEKPFDMREFIKGMPKIGYINSEGHTVLPSSHYHKEDDIYEE